ncbi:peptide deformylase [Shewanella schlegeliana]|uniref:Peptide deformylase n=1 Tax=Shewanella schlegeliana TaxID=190308 RepID=A0ABS1STY4_9GAMM|nr:peptide deformylase [Shewanella schlegeliana]MBL4911998.1 peptide deformylase [Shewanella schlegeliana]MCL1111626.1 peptide deformylase [Shewanella schlegeliana]GIU35272.1 peptide deformylase 3 [Shewanella schlegeliana]
MAVLDILTIPDERLKRKAVAVTDIESVQGFIDDLIETMYDTDDGIGLAATQVGSQHAILVIDLSDERDQPMVLINPEIVESRGEYQGEEGCLSIPGYRAKVNRHEGVKVTALDRHGKAFEIDTDEFLAIVLQHEMDHLNGIVFTDHLSMLKQQVALKKVKKYK